MGTERAADDRAVGIKREPAGRSASCISSDLALTPGTFDYFTDVITGDEGARRGDFTSSEDDNVLVQGVATDELGLVFFGRCEAISNRTPRR